MKCPKSTTLSKPSGITGFIRSIVEQVKIVIFCLQRYRCSGIDGGGSSGRYHRQRGDRRAAGHVLPRAHLHRGGAAGQRRPHVPLPAQHHAAGPLLTSPLLTQTATLPRPFSCRTKIFICNVNFEED